jgi:hypothetical protein
MENVSLNKVGGIVMSIGSMFLLFLISVILCGIAGEVVKRKELHVSKMALAIFHVIYIGGLVTAYILL